MGTVTIQRQGPYTGRQWCSVVSKKISDINLEVLRKGKEVLCAHGGTSIFNPRQRRLRKFTNFSQPGQSQSL